MIIKVLFIILYIYVSLKPLNVIDFKEWFKMKALLLQTINIYNNINYKYEALKKIKVKF